MDALTLGCTSSIANRSQVLKSSANMALWTYVVFVICLWVAGRSAVGARVSRARAWRHRSHPLQECMGVFIPARLWWLCSRTSDQRVNWRSINLSRQSIARFQSNWARVPTSDRTSGTQFV
jgi:hypothetical protein